jgi:hypothetical protein
MLEIDLHGMHEKDAFTLVVQTYNRHVANGQRGKINVIHGYGSTGKGGNLGPRLRDFFKRHKLDFLVGELVDGNLGHTILIPGPLIPEKHGPHPKPAPKDRPSRPAAPAAGGLTRQSPAQLILRDVEERGARADEPVTPQQTSGVPGDALPRLASGMTPGGVRVFRLAQLLNVESKLLLDIAEELGIDVKNQLSQVSPEQRDAIVEHVKRGVPGNRWLYRWQQPSDGEADSPGNE